MNRTEYKEGLRLLHATGNAYNANPLALKAWLLTHAAELLDSVEFEPEPEPMLRGRTSAETCRLNGWDVGDVLAGEELGQVTRLLLTAIGEDHILGRALSGVSCDCKETHWSLDQREWHKEEA